eukprot:1195399-Alexandrium_andersonii.AAC.1
MLPTLTPNERHETKCKNQHVSSRSGSAPTDPSEKRLWRACRPVSVCRFGICMSSAAECVSLDLWA